MFSTIPGARRIRLLQYSVAPATFLPVVEKKIFGTFSFVYNTNLRRTVGLIRVLSVISGCHTEVSICNIGNLRNPIQKINQYEFQLGYLRGINSSLQKTSVKYRRGCVLLIRDAVH